MGTILSVFKGTVIKEAVYHRCENGACRLVSPMQLLTPAGTIDVDLTDTWYPTVKVGDLVECEQGSGWFDNGRLLSYAEKVIIINDVSYEEGD